MAGLTEEARQVTTTVTAVPCADYLQEGERMDRAWHFGSFRILEGALLTMG